jgi:integrase
MFAETFAGKDSYRIWLDLDETDQLLAAADSQEERIAFALGVRSGLQVQEIVDVEAKDVVSTSAGPRVRVRSSKDTEYRKTPTTKDILTMAETVADLQGAETPLVDHSTRCVQRHLGNVTSELAEQGDKMWAHATPHDLRWT